MRLHWAAAERSSMDTDSPDFAFWLRATCKAQLKPKRRIERRGGATEGPLGVLGDHSESRAREAENLLRRDHDWRAAHHHRYRSGGASARRLVTRAYFINRFMV